MAVFFIVADPLTEWDSVDFAELPKALFSFHLERSCSQFPCSSQEILADLWRVGQLCSWASSSDKFPVPEVYVIFVINAFHISRLYGCVNISIVPSYLFSCAHTKIC